MQYVEQLEQYGKESEQVQNSLKQLENEAKNLAKLSNEDQFNTITNIQSNLEDMITLYEQVKGMSMDYQDIQQQWDGFYKDYGQYNGMSADDYAQHARQTVQQTSNAIYDAVKAQGLICQIGNDHKNLQALLDASATAQGALQATQAGNQIMGILVEQMMRMQEIMAQSFRAQTQYYRQQIEAQNEQNSINDTQDFNINNPFESGKGNGPGLDGDFKE
jgi:P-type conjugative transfer protein TrbJ